MESIKDKLKTLGIEEYSKIPFIQKTALRFGVDPMILLAVLILGFFLILMVPCLGSLITNSILFIYPAYKTYKAIESEEKEDDKKLMTYWLAFGLIYSLDTVFRYLLSFIPLYHIVRFSILAFLFFNDFTGSLHLYQFFLQPALEKLCSKVDCFIECLKEGKCLEKNAKDIKKD